ncbi:MAG: glutathione S-transferase family protein [Pedobacter sp.]|nr:glutathione S-transferase family protein [Pedobacter sp.]
MPTLILHHYPMSPFSQKIRSMLGYAGLEWESALTREMPPRPILEKLAGGYRKIPVAQIGADVFCDSRIIAEEIALLSGKPELALANCSPATQAYVAKVDLEIFFDCIIGGGSRKLQKKMREAMSLPDIIRFFWDRINLGRTAKVKTAGFRGMRERVLLHVADVEQRLQADFLGGDRPDHSDFSTWHSLWFIRDLGESRMINPYPKVMAWMDRMKAFGEGSRREISGEQALVTARAATPRAIPDELRKDALIGHKVSIVPADYARLPTKGILVGASANRWIVAREEKDVGTVHVHFPRDGFFLKEI